MSHNNTFFKSSRSTQARQGGQPGPSGSGTSAMATPSTTRTTLRHQERGYNPQTDKEKGKHQLLDSSEDDPEEDEPLVETSTHIVVEHHRTGTVKTHVFSSKDGRPSMLGHAIPMTNNSNIIEGQLLDSKIETMNDLFQESLRAGTKESLRAVKEALRENEDRRSCRHMVQATEALDVQIREEVVPKLNSIAKLLEDNIAGTGRESPSSVKTTSSSMEHMDTRLDANCAGGESSCAKSHRGDCGPSVVGTGASGSAPAISDPLVMEKLTKIEDRIETMYKVVIDGDVPPLPVLGTDGKEDASPVAVDPSTSAPEVDPVMIAKLEEMRREMLTFPDTLQQTHERMGELIQALLSNQQPHSERSDADTGKTASNAEEATRVQDEEAWREYTRSMHQSQYALVLDLGSKLDATSKSNKYALKTFLHFMLMTHNQAKGMNEKVDSALKEMLDRPQADLHFRTEFSEALGAMRADLQRILHELPTAITDALEKIREQEMTDSRAQDVTRPFGEPTPSVISSGVDANSSALQIADQGQQLLETELPALPAGPLTATGQTELSRESVVNPLPGSSSETDPVVAPLTTSPVEHLVTVVESLQANIVSLMQRFSEIPVWIHPDQPIAAVEEATPGDKTEVERELPPVPPRETPMERQARMLLKAAEAAADSKRAADSVTSDGEPASRSISGAEPPVTSESKDAAKETSSKEEVLESKGKETQDEASNDTSPPAATPVPNFLKELNAMSKTLGELVEAVASTTSKLAEGQSAVQQALMTEIQKVMHTLKPPVTEEEREKLAQEEFQQRAAQVEADEKKRVEDKKNAALAEERAIEEAKKKSIAEEASQKTAHERTEALTQIALVPQLFGSVETMGFMVGGKVDDVRSRVDAIGTQLSLGLGTTEQALLTIQQKVSEISTGTTNESAMIASINQHLAVITEATGTGSDQYLKEQVAEAIRTATDVYEIVDDVKKISEKTLENQELLKTRFGEWQRRQEEGFENLGKRGEDSWNAWNALHAQKMSGLDSWHAQHEEHMLALENWHRRHDLSFHGIEEWRSLHDQGLAEWQQRHDEAINSWHQKQDQDLDRLEQKHDQGLERLEQRHCYGCAVSNNGPLGEAASYQPPPPLSDAVENVSNAARGISVTDSTLRSRSLGETGDGPQVSVRGPSQEQSENNGERCDDCSNPGSINRQLHEFLRDAVPGYNGGCLLCGNAPENDASDSKSQWTSGVTATEPRTGYVTPGGTGISLDPNAVNNSGRLPSPAENIADTYRSREAASKAPTTRAPSPGVHGPGIPQALYDILRPFFHPEGAEMVDSQIWTNLQLENSRLKRDFEELKGDHDLLSTQSSQLMVSSMEKDRLLSASLVEKAQLEAERAESKEELKRASDTIVQLYREGLGLKCARDVVEGLPPKSAGESGDSDVESVGSLHTPRYGLMNEAADQLRQTLDEYREQGMILRQEILQLDLEKQQYLQEQATRALSSAFNGRGSSRGTGCASAATSSANDFTDTDAAEDENDEVIEVYPRSRQRRSRPVSMLQLRDGDPAASASSRGGGGGGAYVASASRRQSVTGASQGGPAAGGRRSSDTFNPATFTASASNSSRPLSGSGPSMSRTQHKRASTIRNRSMGPSRSSRPNVPEPAMVPQLEAEIHVCRDGMVAETLLKSKNILTEEQFDSIQRSKGENERAAEDTAIWSLKCDFQVRMVNHP
ncbi:hypothetical protein EMPS_05484 [Entomortierella parvispora]|uniref:Uncharacterized protein n=1 Tax=Entomortierella parvispora TaxID=205924 RepID=A0A9P3HAN2_9FUNG|nr:hypothetical protein EMPS_05484 [Entomortierella parvispora]